MLLIESHKKYTVILTESFCTTFRNFLLLLFLVNFSNLLPQVLQEGQKLTIHVCTVFQSNQRPQKSLVEVITCNLSVKTRKHKISQLLKDWAASLAWCLGSWNTTSLKKLLSQAIQAMQPVISKLSLPNIHMAPEKCSTGWKIWLANLFPWNCSIFSLCSHGTLNS